jgi:hypothetical protein
MVLSCPYIKPRLPTFIFHACGIVPHFPNKLEGHENKLQELKTTERNRILKVDAKQTCLRRVKSEFGT